MLGLVFIVSRLFFPLYEVDGASMDYTLQDGQRVIGTNQFEVNRFDIVIIDVPELNKYYVKRVIGLPGDKIAYKNDCLYINDKFVPESYLNDKKEEWSLLTRDFLIEKIPEGEYFVLGDNRRNSIDSRQLGTIKEANILSELLAIYWPLNQMTVLSH
ncbi:signal peptidase I [Fundicoccus ignavus]|uniref:signal peptidase I n=1 Tax=Fundicoccus ignavus TaxID=2664442 RepID=UPI0024836E6A|nr:signal peptidase I [Fundicoccus ignavus]